MTRDRHCRYCGQYCRRKHNYFKYMNGLMHNDCYPAFKEKKKNEDRIKKNEQNRIRYQQGYRRPTTLEQQMRIKEWQKEYYKRNRERLLNMHKMYIDKKRIEKYNRTNDEFLLKVYGD